ncbi:unnamed protein product [Ixodes pacificus]
MRSHAVGSSQRLFASLVGELACTASPGPARLGQRGREGEATRTEKASRKASIALPAAGARRGEAGVPGGRHGVGAWASKTRRRGSREKGPLSPRDNTFDFPGREPDRGRANEKYQKAISKEAPSNFTVRKASLGAGEAASSPRASGALRGRRDAVALATPFPAGAPSN